MRKPSAPVVATVTLLLLCVFLSTFGRKKNTNVSSTILEPPSLSLSYHVSRHQGWCRFVNCPQFWGNFATKVSDVDTLADFLPTNIDVPVASDTSALAHQADALAQAPLRPPVPQASAPQPPPAAPQIKDSKADRMTQVDTVLVFGLVKMADSSAFLREQIKSLEVMIRLSQSKEELLSQKAELMKELERLDRAVGKPKP